MDQLISLDYVLKCINAREAAAAKVSPDIRTDRDAFFTQLGIFTALGDLREALIGKKIINPLYHGQDPDRIAHEEAAIGRPIRNPRYEVPDDDEE